MIQFFIKHSKELTIAGALSVLTICYFQQRELTKLRTETQTQTQIIDSLNDETFNSRVEAGRYELTLDHLKEVNPKIGKEMEEWMSHETE
jgi:hypothetical protein